MFRKILEFFYIRLAYFLLSALFATYRIRQINEHNREAAKRFHSQSAYILTCWHEHFMAILVGQRGHSMSPIVSRSPVGRVIGYVMQRFGFLSIYGSQARRGRDKGGKEARVALAEALSKGIASAFTVDGSKGPRRVVKPGAIDLAKKCSVAIMPVASCADRYWEFNTWDRFKVPKPFAQVSICYGEPITIAQDDETDYAVFQEQVAQAINHQEELAEKSLLSSKEGSGSIRLRRRRWFPSKKSPT